MIIKPEIRKTCEKCGREVKWQAPELGCDTCGKPFDKEGNRLEVTVFTHNDTNTKHYLFCSWKCVIKFIRNHRTDYFISLPYISFEADTPKEQRLEALLKLLK